MSMRRRISFIHPSLLGGVCLLLLLGAGLSACSGRVPPPPDKLILDPHAAGNDQAASHNTVLSKPLRVQVLGAQERGLLGGKGSRRAVPGVTVCFEVMDPATGARFEGNDSLTLEASTDAGGVAAAGLRLGGFAGDVLVQASLPEQPGIKPVRFRALCGIERIGKDLEAGTGGKIDAFGVRLRNVDGTPAKGVEVSFRVEGDGHGASVSPGQLLTNDNGEAVAAWTLGSKVDRNFAMVEITDNRPDVPAEQRFAVRTLTFKAMSTNMWQMAVVLIGGLAVFIFGMRLMSEGLQKVADRRLKQVLNFMTRNRFMALFAGVLITAMVQSSSATTVMTVGFVNAGLISLGQAIGVVFGANIGTTVTAQIIAFKLDALAYPAIAVGLLLMMAGRQAKWKSAGQAVLGFGLLFLGMSTMSGILKPLKYSPEFVSYFRLFDCTPESGGLIPAGPAIMCVVIGTVMTCVIQSSSATVGLVMALASQGLISFYTAVPLILGDNIGTTITANFAAIGTNRNARRTAMAHTLFNVIGATYMYVLLFVPLWGGQPVFLGFVDAITAGDVFNENPENLLRHVANAHSTFNIFNCLLFLPFTKVMARICRTIIPVLEAESDTALRYLEPKLLQSPAIALQQTVRELLYMVRQGQKSMMESCDVLVGRVSESNVKVLEREEIIDQLQHEIAEYLVHLSRVEMQPAEAALLPGLLHAVNDAERLGDHAEEMLELHHLLQQHDLHIPPAVPRELDELLEVLNSQFESLYAIFEHKDGDLLAQVLESEKKAEQLVKHFTDASVQRMDDAVCDAQVGVTYLDVLNHLERVGQHLVNIAERAVDIAKVTRI